MSPSDCQIRGCCIPGPGEQRVSVHRPRIPYIRTIPYPMAWTGGVDQSCPHSNAPRALSNLRQQLNKKSQAGFLEVCLLLGLSTCREGYTQLLSQSVTFTGYGQRVLHDDPLGSYYRLLS